MNLVTAATPLLASALLLGCSLHSRVVRLPNGAYQLSVVASAAQGGMDRARRTAVADATAYCDRLQRRIWIASVDTSPNVVAVTFTCD